MYPILSNLYRRGDRSPDFYELRMFEYVPLFVYDDFKYGFQHHDYLKGCKYLGRGFTITDKYFMNVTQGNMNAVVFKEDNPESMKKAKIKGEIYAVPPEVLLDIDMFHQNGIMYDREMRNIVLSQQEVKTSKNRSYNPTKRCHMYMGKWDHWKIYNTRSATMFKGPKGIGDYYDFMNPHRWNADDYKDYLM